MSKQYLIIHFTSPHAEQLNYVLIDSIIQPDRKLGMDSLSQIAKFSADRTIIILLPTQQILVTKIQLPPLTASRLAQAIPFAIEEQLTDDLADVQIAYSKQNPTGQINIAVINKHLFQTYLTELKKYQLTPQIILPDVLALPIAQHQWTAFSDASQVWVKTDTAQGFSAPPANINALLELSLQQADNRPDKIKLLGNTTWLNNSSLASTVEINQAITNSSFLELIEITAIIDADLNLLQGEFRSHTNFQFGNNIWQRFIKAGVVALAILFASNLLQWFYLTYMEYHLQTQISTLAPSPYHDFKQYQALEKALFSIAHSNQGGHFFSLLSPIAKVLHQQIPSIQLQTFDFVDNYGLITILANDKTALEKFIKSLKKKDLVVTKQQVTLQKNKILASLKVKP